MPILLSPRQAARAIGVSESSLKRWCDQGVLTTERTIGGHRKLSSAEVLRFLREHDRKLVAPEVLSLPTTSGRKPEANLSRARSLLTEALLVGDEESARRILLDLHLAKYSLSRLGDEVIAGAFREIGERWACHEADVYQERRGCEIILRILYELRQLQQVPPRSWTALGATVEGDYYTLPTALADVVLREAGFQTSTLGSSIPFNSLIKAVTELRPRLFWMSVSHLADERNFVEQFALLSEACRDVGTALIVGGRALGETVRRQLTYAAYCDTLQQLEAFASALLRSRRSRSNRSSGRPPTTRTRPKKARRKSS